MSFLLDTSAVNRICDGAAIAGLASRPAYTTDVVLFELSRTRDTARRQELLEVIRRLGRGGILRGEHPAAGYTPIDDFDTPYNDPTLSLGRPFPLITRAIGSNFYAHWRDGFIVQAAVMHGLTLVTADKRQAKAARTFGASVEYIN